MDDLHETGASDTEQVTRGDDSRFLSPDSALVRAALDLLTTHTGDGEGGDSGLCAHCGLYYPCPTVQHARQVVSAGGMTQQGPDHSRERDPVGAV